MRHSANRAECGSGRAANGRLCIPYGLEERGGHVRFRRTDLAEGGGGGGTRSYILILEQLQERRYSGCRDRAD